MVQQSEMLCFVQDLTPFQNAPWVKKNKNAIPTTAKSADAKGVEEGQESSSGGKASAKKKETRRLSDILKRKSPCSTISRQDEKLESSPDLSQSSCRDRMTPTHEVSLQQQVAAAAAAEEVLTSIPCTNKSRQKKFHRHFKDVPEDEKVIDYYSCALISDILLQGHLYITKNYFAFHSNVFGFVTKLLIPTPSVLSITKERTAYIIPNAVAVCTSDEKHIFGSLLSRDSTYKLMVQVWNAAMRPLHPGHFLHLPSKEKNRPSEVESQDLLGLNDEDSSRSGSDTNLDSPEILRASTSGKRKLYRDLSGANGLVVGKKPPKVDCSSQTVTPTWSQMFRSMSKANVLLLSSTILLVVLFISAGILLYRISLLQQKYSEGPLYLSRSLSEANQYITTNLDQIAKVRQSLEAFSSIMEQKAAELIESSSDGDITNLQAEKKAQRPF